MRFSKALGLAAAIVAAASFSACKSTTAQGDTSASGATSTSMSADGGMGGTGTVSMSADGGAMSNAASDMGAAAGQAGHDLKQGAQAAGHDMAGAAGAAADAGMQAASAAGSAAKDAAGSAASTASGAASGAAAGAADATAAKAGPTDAQIAAIVVAANTVDIDAAKLASKMSKNAKVKAFARSMIKDHTGNNKAAVALVTKLGVTPEENDTSKSLTDGGQKNTDNLKTLKGKDFDKAYVDNEVTYHQAVVDAIDNTLIPSAKNEDLKALLTKTSPVIKEHLEHAKMLQSSMSGAAK